MSSSACGDCFPLPAAAVFCCCLQSVLPACSCPACCPLFPAAAVAVPLLARPSSVQPVQTPHRCRCRLPPICCCCRSSYPCLQRTVSSACCLPVAAQGQLQHSTRAVSLLTRFPPCTLETSSGGWCCEPLSTGQQAVLLCSVGNLLCCYADTLLKVPAASAVSAGK